MTKADLGLLPAKPGVYLMLDVQGKVIYVGKARSLRHRVRSYFQETRPREPRVQAMVVQVDRIEYIITGSEVEALALESNLIKEHRPRYNVKLRDDKQYPLVRITWQEEFPQLSIVRRTKRDGARYFGPYTDAGALRESLRLARRLFPVRGCKRRIGIDHVDRPCLNHHIQRCLAPCVGAVSAEAYRRMIEQVCLFLDGRLVEVEKDLARRMEAEAAQLNYERAAALRDQLADLRKLAERQTVVSTSGEDLDVLGLACGPEGALVQVFLVREGKLVGREHYVLTAGAGEETGEILEAFITQHYGEAPWTPPAILLPGAVGSADALAAWLAERCGRRIRLLAPQRGEKRQLVEMAAQNAALLLEQERARRTYADEHATRALATLTDALSLPVPPRRIEAFDISNIQGRQAVASMAVLLDGKPAPGEYRRFRIRTVEGANDFAMLQEATGRRFRRGLAERGEGRQDGFADLPDLVLIDGGKGQLNAVLGELAGMDLTASFASLAKENEELFLPGRSEPLVLSRDSEALYLVQRIRDEAHRFAVTYHRSVRAREARASLLDEIAGIGPKRKQALLHRFGSVKRIMAASVEELTAVEGMTREAAAAVYAGLHKD